MRLYRSISTLGDLPPPLELQVLLSVPELSANQVLVYHEPHASRIRIDPTPTHILLERWILSFTANPSSDSDADVPLATLYKHAMCVFRSLFTLLRVLPAWTLTRRQRRRGTSRNGSLALVVHVKDTEDEYEDQQQQGLRMRLLDFGAFSAFLFAFFTFSDARPFGYILLPASWTFNANSISGNVSHPQSTSSRPSLNRYPFEPFALLIINIDPHLRTPAPSPWLS